jgi:hypothetical protein
METMTEGMLASIDAAMTDPALRELREALDTALEAVQEIDDDDQPLRLTPEERAIAFEALFFGVGFETTREMLAVYSHLAGLSIGDGDGPSVDVFDPEELLDVNQKQPNLRRDREGVMFFASDGGPGFYAVDVKGATSGRPGAILWADRGSSSAAPVANDLVEFLRLAAAGALEHAR